MSFALILLFLATIFKLKLNPIGAFTPDYLSKNNTTAINGIFVILIVFSHYEQYADFSSGIDLPYLMLKEHLHQMVVATFLFFSGYGMMESIKRKGDTYVNGMWSKFWKLLFRYDVAVCLYLLVGEILRLKHDPMRVVLAFTSWTSVGNSNWYITIVLIMYVLIFLAFKMGKIACKKHYEIVSIHLLILLCLVCVYILMKMDMPSRYYNTQILLPLGLLYSYWKDDIDMIVMKNGVSYSIFLMLTMIIYYFSYMKRWDYGIEGYTAWAILFTLLVVLVAMKVELRSSILMWTGKHVFSIYILQRIPMLVLDRLGLIETHKYACLIAVFFITLPLVIAFEKVTDLIIKGITATCAKLRIQQ